MRPDDRAKDDNCACCKVCTNCPGFQKVLAVPDAGYVLYRHTTTVDDINKETGASEKTTHTVDHVFILEKTQGEDLVKIDVTPEIDRNKIKCPRCVNILKYAQKLIGDQDIGNSDVMGICQHCKNFASTCVKCEEAVEKFQSSKRAQKEIHSQRLKTWLSKIQKNIKLSFFSDKKGKQMTRGYSDVDLSNLLRKIKSVHEPEIEDLFLHDISELYASKRGPGSEDPYFSKAKDKYIVFEEPKADEDKQQEYKEMRKDFFEDDSLIPSITTLTEDDLEKDFIRRFGKSYKSNLKYTSPTDSKGFEQDDFFPVPEMHHKFERKKNESTYYDATRQSEEKSKTKGYQYLTTKKDFGKSVSIDEPEGDARKVKEYYEEKEPKKYIPNDERIYEANRKKYGEEYAKAADQLPDKGTLAKDSEKKLGRKLSSAAKETPSRIRKFRSEESLRTDKTKMNDNILFNETFDYYFPEVMEGQKKLKVKKEVSSSELLTDALDKLKSKNKEGEKKRAEAERLKEERRKRLEQEKKEREERIKAQQMAKSVEKMPNEQDVKSMRQVTKEKKIESSNIKKEEPKEPQNKEKPVASTKLENPKKKIEEPKIREEKPKPERVKEEKPKTEKVKEEKPKPERVKEEKPKTEKVKEEKPKPERVKEEKPKTEKVKEEKPKTEKVEKEKPKPEKNNQEKSKSENDENVKQEKVKEEKVKDEKPKQEKNKERELKSEKDENFKQEKVKEEKVKNEKQKPENNKEEKLKSKIDEKDKQEKVKEEKIKDEKPKPEKNKEQKLKSEKDENVKQGKVKEEKVKNEKQQPENNKEEKLKSKKDEKDKLEKGKEEKVAEEKPRDEKDKDEKPKVDTEKQDDKEHRMKMEQNRRDMEKQMQELKSERDAARKARLEQKAKAKEEAEKKKLLMETAKPQQKFEVTKIKMKKPSIYDLIKEHNIKIPARPKVMTIPTMLEYKKHMCKHGKKESGCDMCLDSDYDLEVQNILWKREDDEFKQNTINEAVLGENIFRTKTKFGEEEAKDPHPPSLFKRNYKDSYGPAETVGPETRGESKSKPAKGPLKPEAEYGVLRYSLSDRSFIDKGWTQLPTEKILRKMNVYRMRPAHPEFDWFEHNKNKGPLQYDTGERLAEIDENGRGRWFYRSGLLALDYYNAEEMNAQHRYVVYSSGEPDERGRTHPRSVLASFDYLGNGIVFDHTGKIRLKFNQTEGIILDRSLGPVSHWKWHTLNDPPVLQQVMIDTQMSHKDPKILKLGGPGENKPRVDDEAMLAIEFDNFIKEKSAKLSQTFKPFQIKMKALKINEYFSLRVLDQANVYLIYRDGKTNIKLNVGMILDHKEIVDTETAEVGEVSSNLEHLPAKTDSLAELQRNIANAQKVERARFERDRRVNRPQQVLSVDCLKKAASKPMKMPLMTVDSSSGASKFCKCRKPSASNVYYGTGFV